MSGDAPPEGFLPLARAVQHFRRTPLTGRRVEAPAVLVGVDVPDFTRLISPDRRGSRGVARRRAAGAAAQCARLQLLDDEFRSSRDLEPWLFEDETEQQTLARLLRELSVGLGEAVGRIGGLFEPWRRVPAHPRQSLQVFSLESGWVGLDQRAPASCAWDLHVAPQPDPDPLPCAWDWLDSAALRLAKRHLVSLEDAQCVVRDAVLRGKLPLATRLGNGYLPYAKPFSPSDVWVARSAIVPGLAHHGETEETWRAVNPVLQAGSCADIVLVNYQDLAAHADQCLSGGLSISQRSVQDANRKKLYDRLWGVYIGLPTEQRFSQAELLRQEGAKYRLPGGAVKRVMKNLLAAAPEQFAGLNKNSLETELRKIARYLRRGASK